jgi:hypothetical protein
MSRGAPAMGVRLAKSGISLGIVASDGCGHLAFLRRPARPRTRRRYADVDVDWWRRRDASRPVWRFASQGLGKIQYTVRPAKVMRQ